MWPLPQIIADVEETYRRQFGIAASRKLRIGDIWRSQAEEELAGGKSGIHVVGPPFRAVDIPMTWEQVWRVAAVINRRYVYDPSRTWLKVINTRRHGTGGHAHCQVSRRTRLKNAA